jgi:hypothetical protein
MNKQKIFLVIVLILLVIASIGCTLEPVDSGGGSTYNFALFDADSRPVTYEVEDGELTLSLKSKYKEAGLAIHYNLNYNDDHKRANRDSTTYEDPISLNVDLDSLRISFYLEIPEDYEGYEDSVYDLEMVYPNSKNGIADIKFSPSGGYFEETVSVSLSCPSGDDIKITLDGTDPKSRGSDITSFPEYNSVTSKLDFDVDDYSTVEFRAVGYDDSGSSDIYGNVVIHYYDLEELESGKVAVPRIYINGTVELADEEIFTSSSDSLTIKFQSVTTGDVDIHYTVNDGYKVEVANGTSDIFLENGYFEITAWAEKNDYTRSNSVTVYVQTNISARDKLYLNLAYVGYDVYIASSYNNFPSEPNYHVRYQGLIVDENLRSFSPSENFYIKIQDPAIGIFYYPKRNATLAGSNSMYNPGYSFYNLSENRFYDYWSNGSLWNLTDDNPYLASSVNVLN